MVIRRGEGRGHLEDTGQEIPSELSQWPIQLMLLPPNAVYFQGADIIVGADCVAYAFGDFHRKFLRGHALAIGCPKLDNGDLYVAKVRDIVRQSSPKSITVAIMEVPCCWGLVEIVKQGVAESGRQVPVKVIVFGVSGEVNSEEEIQVSA